MADAIHPGPPPPPYDQLRETAHGQALAEIGRRLAAIEHTEERRAGASELRNKLFAAFGSAITAGALAFGTWIWSVQADVGQLRADVDRGVERLEEHRASGGGHPEAIVARVSRNEGRIEANAASAARIEARLAGVESKLEEILERLPRRTR